MESGGGCISSGCVTPALLLRLGGAAAMQVLNAMPGQRAAFVVPSSEAYKPASYSLVIGSSGCISYEVGQKQRLSGLMARQGYEPSWPACMPDPRSDFSTP